MNDVLVVVEVFRRALEVDLNAADVVGVRGVLADLARVQSAVDVRRVQARRRLDWLGRAGAAVCTDVELARAGNTTGRDAAQIGDRDRTLAELPELEDALRAGTVAATPRNLTITHPDTTIQTTGPPRARTVE